MKKFKYSFAKYPKNNLFLEKIFQAASSLDDKLSNLDVNSLNISEYNKRYFGDHIKTNGARKLNLTKYSYVLAWALNNVAKPLNEIVFLDYGAGHGFLSLLAKELGVGKVIHNDIYAVSSIDAKIIAENLKLEANEYITGDINDVINFLNLNNLNCHSMGSYDVIEHIYDIDEFLNKNHLLSNDTISIFHASAANENNPRINRMLKKTHLIIENTGRDLKPGRKATDASRPLIEIRKDIIRAIKPSLSDDEISLLSKNTRGMIKDDIETAINNYISKSIMPKPDGHATNTCDPNTGNWYEHLMNPYELFKILESQGFEGKVMSGYYDSPKSLHIKFVKEFLNICISASGEKGLFFAPFYALYAFKS
jgi:2-polyprenyl-3-methyl-5-hydroxy-6-metoxy-1,4-benzoquinol methylase